VTILMRGAAVAALIIAGGAAPAAAGIVVADDPILFWNQQMVSYYTAPPPVQARGIAMANIAMHDAVNAAIGGADRSYLHGVAAPMGGGDARAAASQAAYRVMSALNAPNAAQYQTALDASLGLVADGAAKTAGIAAGNAYANAILAARGSDGSTNPGGITYTTTGLPGDYRPTTDGAAAALPFWGTVTPFVLSSASQFRAPPPPTLGSAAYTTAYNEVKAVGASNSMTRTEDQRNSALFWDTANGSTWINVGLIVGQDEGLSTLGFASAFARLSTGLADAAIAGFDAKYAYRYWRPLTAIQNGDADGNSDTAGDAAWQPLFATPLHPSYVSTHALLSATGATILKSIFGDDEGFTFSIGADTRSFTGLIQAAHDGADSRVWGGIHFRFDSDAGYAMGEQIGAAALRQQAFGVPEPASWMLMITGFGALGGVARRRRRHLSLAG
jgi:hypothetical protein